MSEWERERERACFQMWEIDFPPAVVRSTPCSLSFNGGQSRRDTIPVQKNAVAIRIEAVKTSLISPQSPKRVPARSPNSICPKTRLPSFHTKKFSFRQHKKTDETCNFYFPSPPRSAH